MHSQNQVLPITNPTGRVQHTTEVQVQEHLHVLTVLHLQNQVITAVHLQEVAVAEITIVEVAAEVVVVHIQVDHLQVDQVEVPADQVVDLRGAVPVHPVAAHLQGVDKINAITLVS